MIKLESIYAKLPNGYDVSRIEIAKEKELGNYDGTVGLGYGEIDLLAFQQFLFSIPLPTAAEDDKIEFCDFGSGTGKAVLVAASTGLFKISTGIELMQPLHDVAEQAMKQADGLAKINLLCGDMFAHEQVWQSAHVIFITCTLFTDEMMEQVSEYVDKHVRTGAIIMCTTRKLTGKGLNLIKEERIKYAKGSLMCFVYRRHRRVTTAAAAGGEGEKKKPSKRVKV